MITPDNDFEDFREPMRADEVGRRVREARQAAGMTQKALGDALAAKGLRCYQQTILRIEKGTRALGLVEAQMIARVFGSDLTMFGPGQAGLPSELARANQRLTKIARLAGEPL